MIQTKTTIVITLFLLSISYAQAANIDFNSIYNNALDACNNNQIGNDCKSMKESNHECDSTKTKDGIEGNEANLNKQCSNVYSDKNYVEPKFSTKRPRGQ